MVVGMAGEVLARPQPRHVEQRRPDRLLVAALGLQHLVGSGDGDAVLVDEHRLQRRGGQQQPGQLVRVDRAVTDELGRHVTDPQRGGEGDVDDQLRAARPCAATERAATAPPPQPAPAPPSAVRGCRPSSRSISASRRRRPAGRSSQLPAACARSARLRNAASASGLLMPQAWRSTSPSSRLS
jgi:hypothetical protein